MHWAHRALGILKKRVESPRQSHSRLIEQKSFWLAKFLVVSDSPRRSKLTKKKSITKFLKGKKNIHKAPLSWGGSQGKGDCCLLLKLGSAFYFQEGEICIRFFDSWSSKVLKKLQLVSNPLKLKKGDFWHFSVPKKTQ